MSSRRTRTPRPTLRRPVATALLAVTVALPLLVATVTAQAETTDADRDGLTDVEELAWGLDAAVADSDGDGITDGDEMRDGYAHTDPANADTDADGLGDGAEYYFTDPWNYYYDQRDSS